MFLSFPLFHTSDSFPHCLSPFPLRVARTTTGLPLHRRRRGTVPVCSMPSSKRKARSPGSKAEPANAKIAKSDEYGEYINKDIYGTKVSVETESDQFKVAERVGKMRADNSDSICASDYEMKRAWSQGWTTGYIRTIGIRRSTGPPAPRRPLSSITTPVGE